MRVAATSAMSRSSRWRTRARCTRSSRQSGPGTKPVRAAKTFAIAGPGATPPSPNMLVLYRTNVRFVNVRQQLTTPLQHHNLGVDRVVESALEAIERREWD